MKILLTGGTGFVGKELGVLLTSKGYEINCLCRNPQKESKTNTYPANYYKWDGEKDVPSAESLEGVDVVIHLAGENIASQRWTKSYKEKLINSRVASTKNLMEGLRKAKNKPSLFISASAVGYYGNQGECKLDENSPKGNDFLADLCEQWENASLECESLNIRRCVLRFGLVMSELGGFLDQTARMSLHRILSRSGLSGTQWMSWVALKDLCKLMVWCIENNEAQGVYNAVSEGALQNKNFVHILSKTFKNPFLPPVPAFLLKLVLGERSALLLSSQNVGMSRAVKEGFSFEYNNFETFLSEIGPIH